MQKGTGWPDNMKQSMMTELDNKQKKEIDHE